MKQVFILVMVLIAGGNILKNAEQYNQAHPLVYVAEAQVIEPREVLIEIQIDWTKEKIIQELETQAQKYGVSSDVMKTVVNCESQYNRYALGDGGKSRGLVQIHSGYHDVSDEDAYDPAFALEFLAKNLAQGNGKLWTCHRMNYN